MTRLRRSSASCLAVTLLLVCLMPARAAAWGGDGHRIVALVATNHLTPQARDRVAELLGEDETLASVATFADEIRNSRPDTKEFHFVDIPRRADNYDPARDCRQTENGDCIINAIDRFRRELADTGEREGRRRFALKFLVHLIGDLHQPLHCADDNDRGGNDVKVTWFGRSGKGINLHSVWDSLIINEAGLDEEQFADALEEGLTEQQVRSIQRGSVIDWALEAHKVAQDNAYRIPRNRRLGPAYYDRNAEVVDLQLLRGGLRLARVLNETLR